MQPQFTLPTTFTKGTTPDMSDSYAELMPGRFFKAEDFANGSTKTLTIKSFDRENVAPKEKPAEMKPVVRFEESDQGCTLNLERAQALKDLFGPAPSDAIGKPVTLCQGKTRFGGKTVPCVAFKAAAA